MATQFPANGTLDKKYVSLLDSELDKREIDQYLGDAFKNNDFNSIMGLETRKETVTQRFWATRVTAKTDYLVDTTGATVSGSGTNTVTTSTSDLTALKFVRVGTILHSTNASNSGATSSFIVQTISTVSSRAQIVMKSVSGTPVVSAGDKFIVGGIIGGEKSGTPTPLRSGLIKYTNQYSIIIDSEEISDVEKANKVEFTFKGQDSFSPLALDECLSRVKNSVNKEFIFGNMSSTTFADASPFLTDLNTANGGGGGAQQTSRGLYSYIQSYGVVGKAVGSGSSGSPVPNGTFVKADLNAMISSLVSQRADMKQLVVGSTASMMAVSDYAKNLNSSGATSVRLNIAGKELDCDVIKIIEGGFELNLAVLPILNNDTHQYHLAAKSIMCMPFDGKAQVQGGGVKPAMCLKYVKAVSPKGLGSDMISEAQEGTQAPTTPSGTINMWRTKYETKQGLDVKVPTQLYAMQILS